MYKNKNNSFDKYLKTQFEPAMRWAATTDGAIFIRDRIPTLFALLPNINDCLFAVYSVWVNDRCSYIGQSIRTVKRLIVHAWHMSQAPELYFGLKDSEITSIKVKLLTPPILSESDRLNAEAAAITEHKPILQPYYNIAGMRSDACLPRGKARRDAMVAAGVISEEQENDDSSCSI